jgi:dimethylglycine dehydrogenase
MCCGTSFGIAQGGGCGKFLAQWMIQGDAEINMTEFDPRRFGPYADLKYVHEKVFLDYRTTFTTRLPGEEEPDARPNKVSPLYERLRSQGCVYTETFGWERPKWFCLDGRVEESGYRRNNVFEVVRDEVAAVHERAGLLDLTGFAKYDITGPDAEGFLNRVCANRIPRKVGGIALVHMLSSQGRILGEMTVTKLAEERFYALSAAAAELRDRDWLLHSVRAGERVEIDNVTEQRGVLVLSGPRSREILAPLTDTPLDSGAFPWLTGREIRVAGNDVRALRVSYVGELGWELHPKIGSLAGLYEALWERGRAFGIANYGLYAVNSMRVEKGYKAWSTELTNELTLLEADMPRFFAANKDDFIGKTATLAQTPRPLKIVYAEVAAAETDARGGEPLLAADGRCIGVTTSGAYGHRVKKSLAFACVEPAFEAAGSTFDILLQGERRRATVLPAAAFDADNSRMRV